MAVGIAQFGRADDPVGDAARLQVVQRPALVPEGLLVERGGGIHRDLLFQREPIPAAFAGAFGGLQEGTWQRRQSGQPLHRPAEVHSFPAHHKVDDVAVRMAAETVEVLIAFVHHEAGLLIVVERAAAAEPVGTGRTQLDTGGAHRRCQGIGRV